MRTTLALLLGSLALTSCAQNPWWEASQSGWAIYGPDILVPRKAKPVPLSLMLEAETWGQPVYIEGWVNSVEGEHGEWMTISDGTSPPVIVIPQSGFALPRNARGRRAMAWGRPLGASGTVSGDEDEVRTVTSVEFMAETVMIQGYYGLEPSRPRSFEPPALPTRVIEAPESNVDAETAPEEVDPPVAEPEIAPAADDPPIVDLPDR